MLRAHFLGMGCVANRREPQGLILTRIIKMFKCLSIYLLNTDLFFNPNNGRFSKYFLAFI